MSDLTPLHVVQTYNDVCWGRHQRDLVTKLVANPLRRHHPGRTEVFTHEDMLRRYDGYFAKHTELRATGSRAICEGPYVSLLWTFEMVANDGGSKTISGIEIFKVENGKITEVWNPNGVAEEYPAGPWPEFEK
jgi:predicted SnoaL-like aldol condensation-catalyzing enzyme